MRRILWLFLLLFLLPACSGTAPSSPPPGQAASEAPVVRVEHDRVSARGLGPGIDQIRFVGRNDAGRLVYGPELRPAEELIELEGVPLETRVLELHYLSGGQLAGYFAAALDLAAGSQLIDNPPWQSISDLTGLEITPTHATVPAGTETRLGVVGTFADGTRLLLTTVAAWASQDTAIATVSNDLDFPGVVRGLSFGFTRATATLGSFTAEAPLTVNDVPLESLVLTPANASLSVGLTQQYQATGVFADGRELDVSASVDWSSSAPEVATIDQDGLLTAAAEGRAVVLAALGNVRGTTNLRVSDAALVSLEIQPENGSTPVGIPIQLQATGTFSDGSRLDVTDQVRWGSDDDESILVAPTGLAQAFNPGTFTVDASLAGVTDQVSVTVTPAIPVAMLVTTLQTSAPAGREVPFTAQAFFSDGTSAEVTQLATWTTGDPARATVSNAPAPAGLVRGLAPGVVPITATLGDVQASLSFEVTPAELDLIQVTPVDSVLVYESATTRQMAATGIWTDGSQQDLTSTVQWSSSDPTTVSLDATGLATALDRGRVLVTATSGDVSGATELTVRSGTLTGLVVEPSIAPLTAVGGTRKMRAFGVFAGSALSPTGEATDLVDWSSANPAVATVANSALDAGVATGVSEGSSLLTATDPVTGLSSSRQLHVNFFLYILGGAGELVGLDIDLAAQTSTPVPDPGLSLLNPQKTAIDPSGRYLFLVDGNFLGIFRINPANGTLAFVDSESGFPSSAVLRELAFDPRGRFFFATGNDDTLYQWAFEATTGQAALANAYAFLDDATALAVHPSGRFLFQSNGSEQLDLAIDPDTGDFLGVLEYRTGPLKDRTYAFLRDEGAILYGDNTLQQVMPDGTVFFLALNISGGPQIALAQLAGQRYLFSPNRTNGARNILAYFVTLPTATSNIRLDRMPGAPYPTGGSDPSSGGIPLELVVHPSQGVLFVVTNIDVEWHSISDRLSLIRRDPLSMSQPVSAVGTP